MEKKKVTKENKAAYLEKVSIHGGLLSFFYSEKEAQACIRQLCFPDMQSDTALHYLLLSDKNRELIGRLAKKLSRGREHRGFNLHLYLYWLTKSYKSDPKLTNSLISKNLYMIYSDLPEFNSVSVWLSQISNRPNIKVNGVYFEYLKDNLLFSTELITTGAGYIDIVKPDAIEEYYNHPEIYKEERWIEDDTEYLMGISVREKLEKLAAYTGRKWEDIVDRKYCIINYTYSYALLDESSRELVDEFIEVLYEDNKGAELLVGLYQSLIDGTIKADTDDE